ncbi:hypothetical protein B0T10DRAFT_148750 [Thelonectria olida]|uniref:N-acetyltransferase domain-containing protein n=1 Tax=Thelonectria olida TaxID=1576542 RepID=A0A9P8VVQ2_9HYPO|nr:hypothetical protein B0T10DRAFT_148750 [Thelonectria olida]
MPPFYIRDAGASSHAQDAQFIVDAFDSAIPHLTAAGSAGQWGSEPLSRNPNFHTVIRDALLQSEKFRDTGLGEERVRVFVAEVEVDSTVDGPSAATLDDNLESENSPEAVDRLQLARRLHQESGKTFLSVGAAKLRDDSFANHVLYPDNLRTHTDAATKAGSFVFLDFLVADHRVLGERRKGAGGALIDRVKQYAMQHGKRTIWVDCWAGGSGRLVQYYQDMGFTLVEKFEVPRRDSTMWQGNLFRMDVA